MTRWIVTYTENGAYANELYTGNSLGGWLIETLNDFPGGYIVMISAVEISEEEYNMLDGKI